MLVVDNFGDQWLSLEGKECLVFIRLSYFVVRKSKF
jgi:hypothetical protein